MNQDELFMSGNPLAEVSEKLGVDKSTVTMAQRLLVEYHARASQASAEQTGLAARCSLLAASKSLAGKAPAAEKEKFTTVTLNAIAADVLDVHALILTLKEFARLVKLEDSVVSYLQRLINSFAFSLTLYNKYQQIWEQIQLEGPNSEKIIEIGWHLFVLARVNLLQRRSEPVECAYMMLSVIYVLLKELPANYRWALETTSHREIRNYLCSLLRAQERQVKASVTHFEMVLKEFSRFNVLRTDVLGELGGALEFRHLDYNLQSLNEEYEFKLLPEDIDERRFIRSAPVTVKPSVLMQKCMHRFSEPRLPHYIEDDSLTMNSRLQDVRVAAVPTNGINTLSASTPEVTRAEVTAWLDDQPSVMQVLNHRLEPEALQVLQQILDEMRAKIDEAVPNMADFTVKLVHRVLIEVIKNDDRQQDVRSEARDNLAAVLKNDSLYRALLACCLESALFMHATTSFEFGEVLELCGVPTFDVWKLIKNFIEFDPKIPAGLRTYFRALECRIIGYLVWTEDSQMTSLLRQQLNAEVPHIALQIFCKRVLSHCVQRLVELSRALGAAENVREAAWRILKLALGTYTEILINRHIDQVIVCSLYAAAYALNATISFNTLIAKYCDLYNDSGMIFRRIFIEHNRSGDVVTFYNSVFVLYFKTIMHELNKTAPPPAQQPKVTQPKPLQPMFPAVTRPTLEFTPVKQSPDTYSPAFTPDLKLLYGGSPTSDLEAGRLGSELGQVDLPKKRTKPFNSIFDTPSEGADLPGILHYDLP